MIEFTELDLRTSKFVYDECEEVMEMKQCYANVYYAAMAHIDRFEYEGWQIAYGYMATVANIMVRHAWIVSGEGQVIDPTKFTREDIVSVEPHYVAFKVFEDVQEYIDMVEANDDYVDLQKPLRPLDEAFQKSEWAKNSWKAFCS